MSFRIMLIRYALFLSALALVLAGCRTQVPGITPNPGENTPAPGTTPGIPNSPTPFQPSPTPLPMAASVNGAPVLLSDYEAALARHASALGRELTPEEQQQTLDELIDELLLAQAAEKEGYTVDDSFLAARLAQLANEAGGEEALRQWQADQGYTAESFQRALRQSLQAAWMRDRVIAAQPQAVEQVHARQILLFTADAANQMLARVQAGTSFTNLAVQNDPVTEGELGWFPRGYLLHPQLEEAAFNLQPGEISAVIQSPVGYHILQVIERDPQRALDPEPLRILQADRLKSWFAEQRQASDIQVFSP